MQLTLKRKHGLSFTPGELFINDVFECQTLEDMERDEKVPGDTAIPVGTYKVIITLSNRFNRMLPLLVDVPNFSGVRIHPGNTTKDTEGCILLGKDDDATDNWLGNSRAAFNAFYPKILAAINNDDDVFITIE